MSDTGNATGELDQQRQLTHWPRFYAAVGRAAPRRTLLEALERFEAEAQAPDGERLAVDLGCGSGPDTRELLRRGWCVIAIDSEPAAISAVRALRSSSKHRLEARLMPFQTATWPVADLVNASYALPFCPPAEFANVWQRIVESVRTGGRFAGQLFGDRDSWVGKRNLTYLSRDELVPLLARFEVELLHEEESDRPTALGEPKHWHVFDIVARKLPER